MQIYSDESETTIDIPFKGSWAKFSTADQIEFQGLTGEMCLSSKADEWTCVVPMVTTNAPSTMATDASDFSTVGTTVAGAIG